MSCRRIYLDYNATAPLLPEARTAMLEALDLNNASSVHFEGRAARAVIEHARSRVASLVGGAAKNVIFTSGGTESANLALYNLSHSPDSSIAAPWLGLCATEHPAVLKGNHFASHSLSLLPVDCNGVLNLGALEQLLVTLRVSQPERRLILALQYANNETGVLQPLREAAAMVHADNGLVVCDSVQAAGKIPLSFECGADVILLSAHKFGGPKGAGAVVFASRALNSAWPLMLGGGQEQGFRAGTQNIAAIAGFGAAAATNMAIPPLREKFEQVILKHAPDAVIFGLHVPRLVNTICFAVPGLSAETLLIAFDLAGIALSAGSACSSGKVSASHVLTAMNVPDTLVKSALRLSFGWATTPEDVASFEAAFINIIYKARRKKP